MKNRSEILPPCPGCNQAHQEELGIGTDGDYWWVSCSCECSGTHMPTREEAIQEWKNMPRREDAAELVEALKTCMGRIPEHHGGENYTALMQARAALEKWGK